MAAWTVLISDGNLNELLSDIEQLAPYYDLSGIDECGCTTAHSPPPRSSNSPTQPVNATAGRYVAPRSEDILK